MKQYIIYDARAINGTDEATVMECCDTLDEAIESAPDYGEGCCIYSYDIEPNKTNDGTLVNEQFETQVYSD